MSQQQQFHRDGSPVAAMELREPNETTSLSTLHGYAPREGHFSENQKRMGGRYSRIAWNFSMLAIPMFLFVAILLGLVFHYQIQTKDPPFTNLRLPDQQNDSNVYYVRISSTILVFIASWSSSLAPTLASFALALVSYPIAGKYLRAARTERIDGLMTPYQLFLTLRLLDGGVVRALWSWLRYVVGWRKHRERQARPLSTTASVALLALCLGVAVFLSDTWLHVTTKTVNFVQVSPVTSGIDYSFGLIAGCVTGGNNSYNYFLESSEPCTLKIGGTAVFLVNGSQSIQVLNNVSDSMIVYTYDNTPYTYLGVPPSETLSQRDYTATTFGMQTQCMPVSTACNLTRYDGASTPFHCSDAFSGDVTQDLYNWYMEYLADGAMSSNETDYGVQNPYFFGLAALVNPEGGSTLNESVDEIVQPMHGGIAFVLNCSTTVYNIEYDSVNGTVTRFAKTPSNDSVANIWQGANAYTSGGIGTPNLQQAASLAAFSNSAQELADKMALAYSKTALAIGAEAVVPKPALAAQERESFLVSRVPKAPLFTLVLANLLFAVLGVVLTVVALATSGGEVREVQARMTLVGLVADRFEGSRGRNGVEEIKELFEETEGKGSLRVGIDYAEGSGYSYRVWPNYGQ